jgi:hypothetical protein
MSQRYISSAAYFNSGAVGDMEFRNILKGVVDVTDEAGTFMDVLELSGRFVPTTDQTFFSYTNDWLFSTLTVAAAGGASIAAGATGTVTVTSATAAAKLKRGDILEAPATGVQMMVVSVSGAALTVATPDDAGGATAFANDAVLTVAFNVIPEGGSSGDEPEIDLVKRTNQINIIESSTSVSDLRAAAKTVVDFGDGEEGVIYKDQHDVYTKHKGKEGFNFLMSKHRNYAAVDSGFAKDAKTTRGLNSYIQDYGGITHTASNAGSTGFSGAGFDDVDVFNFSRKLDKARAPKEGMLMCGGDFGASFDKIYSAQVNASVDFSMFGEGDAKKRILDLGVGGVHLYDRTYVKMASPTMDHQYVTSTTGSLYAKTAFFIPSGKIKAGGSMVDRMRGRYLELGQYANGRLKEKVLGGLAPGGATERANKVEWAYTSWVAPEINGTQHFGRFQAA